MGAFFFLFLFWLFPWGAVTLALLFPSHSVFCTNRLHVLVHQKSLWFSRLAAPSPASSSTSVFTISFLITSQSSRPNKEAASATSSSATCLLACLSVGLIVEPHQPHLNQHHRGLSVEVLKSKTEKQLFSAAFKTVSSFGGVFFLTSSLL